MKKVVLILAGLISFAYAQDSVNVRTQKNPVKQFKVWYDGKQYDADDLDVICVEEDFATFATFRWTLTDSLGTNIAMGYVRMQGADYEDYVTKPNHGQKAVSYVMTQLNLVPRPKRRQ